MTRVAVIVPWVLSNRFLVPSQLKQGSSGAEETLINFTHQLFVSGLSVTVFYKGISLCEDAYGAHWKDLTDFNSDLDFSSVIFWNDYRSLLEPLFARCPPNARTYVRFVNQISINDFYWLHSKSDYIVTQSHWLLSKYPIRPKNVIFCPNGIDKLSYDVDVQHAYRCPNTFIYGSEYDRGLSILLDLWPHILNINPNAKLKIFHGWSVFDSKLLAASGANKTSMLAFKSFIESKISSLHNVVELGRISHHDVIIMSRRARALLYPCIFPENCSTLSLKVQAAGCDIVSISCGGLPETLGINTYRTMEVLWSDSSIYANGDTSKAVTEFRHLCLRYISSTYSPVDFDVTRSFINKYSYSNVFHDLISSLLSH